MLILMGSMWKEPDKDKGLTFGLTIVNMTGNGGKVRKKGKESTSIDSRIGKKGIGT